MDDNFPGSFQADVPTVSSISGFGASRASRIFGRTFTFMLFFCAPLYLIYTYFVQFDKFGPSVAIIVSAAVSLFLVAYAINVNVEHVTSSDKDLADAVGDF